MFTKKDIEKVMQNLDSNKAHGHDMTSISMLKICSKSIIKLLLIIYKKCLQKGCFPTSGRKQMLFLFIKKWQTATKKLVYNHPQGKLPPDFKVFLSVNNCHHQIVFA